MNEVRQVRQIEPEEKPVKLEGMYLEHNLQELAKKKGRLVVGNYLADKNSVIAREDVPGPPIEIQEKEEEGKNSTDWDLFNELAAQADINITGGEYLNRFVEMGDEAQNVLTQFDKGEDYEKLGDWRERNGLNRNPDVAVVSRSLKFEIPKEILDGERQIFIFTTNKMAESDKAKALNDLPNVTVVPAGDEKDESVDGAIMVKRLGQEGCKVIKMTTGPRILKILLDAGILDRFYITRVNRKIEAKDVVRIPNEEELEKLGFRRIIRYRQEGVITKDGRETSQEFLVYEKA